MKGDSIILVGVLLVTACTKGNYVGRKIDQAAPIENRTDRHWVEGWLEIEENRLETTSGRIELPFILSKTADSLRMNQNPILIMSGGPGNSSLNMANGVVNTTWGKVHDVLVLEQRGTTYSKPMLACPEIDSLRILGLRSGLTGERLDSLKMAGTKMCYERLSARVDLNGYNTLESVQDIEDLRRILNLEKLILYGMSYSCNLMATYAQTFPENVEAVILDSPLPHNSN